MINKNTNSKQGALIAGGQGFSLVELMLVIAIIGILAGIVTVSLSGVRDKGDDTKILAELSATIQPMLMCRSDNGVVGLPDNGNVAICDLSNNYGWWPDYGVAYSYVTSGDVNDFNKTTQPADDWYFYVDGKIKRICCNEISKKCGIISKTTICDSSIQL